MSEACPHGIRSPWACDECDEIALAARVVWYRVWGDVYESSGAHLRFKEYEVVRETEKSVYLKVGYDGGNFCERDAVKRVLKEARRRWAYPTKELAIDSFIQRKAGQLGHLENMRQKAQALKDYAERWVAAGMQEPPPPAIGGLIFEDEGLFGEELLKPRGRSTTEWATDLGGE